MGQDELSTTDRYRFFRLVREGDLEAVQEMLDSGVDPNSPNESGITPICVAEDSATVDLLLTHGASESDRRRHRLSRARDAREEKKKQLFSQCWAFLIRIVGLPHYVWRMIRRGHYQRLDQEQAAHIERIRLWHAVSDEEVLRAAKELVSLQLDEGLTNYGLTDPENSRVCPSCQGRNIKKKPSAFECQDCMLQSSPEKFEDNCHKRAIVISTEFFDKGGYIALERLDKKWRDLGGKNKHLGLVFSVVAPGVWHN